jgi:site-specific DNA-methyltransferase (adenine-specific)
MSRLAALVDDSVTPVIDRDDVTLLIGDAVKVLPLLVPGIVDSVVTDPPYGLGFDAQSWDGVKGFRESLDTGTDHLSDGEVFQTWNQAWGEAVLGVLKPGGHVAAFGGARTWHRLVAGVEAAGFEIRDQIAWLYSSGVPKSMDISNAIDHHLGQVRPDRQVNTSDLDGVLGVSRRVVVKGEPVTGQAQQAAGWGTGLRPAFEPILIARKPLDGTVVANVLEHGTQGTEEQV